MRMGNLNKKALTALAIFVIVIFSFFAYGLIINQTPKSQSQTLTPTSTPISNITLSYNETSRENIGDDSKITLTVNATFINGSEININFSQFYLQMYVVRGLIDHIPEGTENPLNNGTFTLGTSQQTNIFQLTFEFPTYGFNGMDTTTTQYNLEFNGTASIQWINQSNGY